MKTIKGDLLQLFDNNRFNVIIHGCNCFNTMGAGIAKQIKEQFPEAYAADQLTTKGDSYKLGKFSMHKFTSSTENTYAEKYIINAYTQYEYSGKHPVDYCAIRKVFLNLNYCEDMRGKLIGIPKIGAGLAGGDWGRISKIIEEAAPYLNITVVEYNGGV